MSVVVGHTLTGLALTEAGTAGRIEPWWRVAFFAAVIANLPDFDLLAGIVAGDPTRFHHGPMHSLGAALVAGLAAGIAGGARRRGFAKLFLLTAAVYASHVLLDAVSPERAGPRAGVALLWPISAHRLSIDVPMPDWLFHALSLDGGAAGFVSTVLSWDTIGAMAMEAMLFAPMLVIALVIRRRAHPAIGG